MSNGLAEVALSLDRDFSELERLSGQIEKAEIGSENDLEHIQQLLARYGECGLRVGESVQVLAGALDEARIRSEKASQSVAARLAAIQDRQRDHALMRERFGALAKTARELSSALGALQPKGEGLSSEQKNLLAERLPEIESKLDFLAEEAFKLKADAQSAGMKTLVSDADSMGQSLRSARKKLSAAAG